jgi:hypothetical protein
MIEWEWIPDALAANGWPRGKPTSPHMKVTIKHNSSRWRTYAPESRRVNACVMVALTLTFAASRSRTSGDEEVSPGLRSSQVFVVTSWHCVCLQLLSSKISLRINALLV